MSLITVCGYRRETRASLSIARVLVVGQKLFLVGLGGAPSSAEAMEDGAAPRESCPSFSPRGTRSACGLVQSKPKRSPLITQSASRAGRVVLSWCLFRALAAAPFGAPNRAQKRLSPRVASCDFASQSDLRSGCPRLRSAQQSGLPRELSPMYPCLCVPHRARRFKAATSSLLCRHTGRVTAAKPTTKSAIRYQSALL